MPELFHGGAEKQFRAIISGLDKKAYEVIVVDEHVYGNTDVELNKKFLQNNKQVHYIELKKRKTSRLLKYLLINKDMLFILLKYKPGLVFSSSLKLSSLCNLLRIPFVYSERNSAMGENYYKKKKKALLQSTWVTCNSITAWEQLKAHGIEAQFIANGIEECEMDAQEPEEALIVVPARISAEKNQEVVIEALKFIPNNAKVILVGKVSETEYLEHIRNRINDLNFNDRVKILEFTNDIKNLYQKSSVIVLPSLTEGLSNVILESYMYGRICILSDIPQNKAAGSDNQRYFEPTSAKILADKIIEVLQLNSDEYRQECILNHEYVINRFGMKKMIEEYRKVFDDIIFSVKR